MGVGLRTSVLRGASGLASGSLCLGVRGVWYLDLRASLWLIFNNSRGLLYIRKWDRYIVRKHPKSITNERCVTSQKSERLTYAPASV